jgi:hypothetical protein
MPTQQMMVSLSDQTLALIFGSLLGNGSIKLSKDYVNAQFSFSHLSKQRNYFEWKVKKCIDISDSKAAYRQRDDFSKDLKLTYQSNAMPALTDIYRLTHDKGHFRIRRKWLNRMSGLSLAIWWLDDGSIIANHRKGVFRTDGFDENSVKLIARYLQVKWGIRTQVVSIHHVLNGKRYDQYRVWIRSTEELKKLLRIIAPYVEVKDMLYKVLVLYKDPELQQRWISELASLTSFSAEEITAEVIKRKQALKAFQKKI